MYHLPRPNGRPRLLELGLEGGETPECRPVLGGWMGFSASIWMSWFATFLRPFLLSREDHKVQSEGHLLLPRLGLLKGSR